MEIYHQCIHGNYQEVERLKQKFESRANAVSSSRADGSSDDEDDDVDNDQDDDGDDDNNAMVCINNRMEGSCLLNHYST